MKFYCYELDGPLDVWDNVVTVGDWIIRSYCVEHEVEGKFRMLMYAMEQLTKETSFGGISDLNLIGVAPVLEALEGDSIFHTAFIFKEHNNGATYIASESTLFMKNTSGDEQ